MATPVWPAAAALLGRAGPAWRLVLAAAAGIGFALAQPPWGLWPLLFLCGPVLFHLWRPLGWRAAFGVGWAFGAAYFAVGLHWIVEPFLVDAAATGWMAPFALVFLAGGLALFPAAGLSLAAALRPRGDWPALALAALGLAAGEFTRSWVFTGFPWALSAYAWVETPVAQMAAHTGPYALSLLTLLLAFAPALGFGRWRLGGAAFAVAVVGALWGLGAARTPAVAPMTDVVVRIVQPNTDQATKWDPALTRVHFDTLLDLTRAADGARPDIVVWPESAVTFPIDSDMAAEARAEIAAAAGGAEVVTGSLRARGGATEGARWRNSMFLLNADGALSAPFDKIHLVPFGEYLPFEDVLNRLGVLALASRGLGLEAGEAPVLMTPSRAPPFAPLICYEMIFPEETMAAARGAEWLVLGTNDAWFGAGAGPVQHLAQARMRAIETGLPVARAANTGISAMIDGYGRLTGSIAHGERGFIDRTLPRPVKTGLYRENGETFSIILVILCSILGFNRPKSGNAS